MSTSKALKVATDAEVTGLHAKLVHVRAHIGAVEKSKTNQQLRYEYRTEDDYYNAVRPLLDEVGVMLYASAATARIEEGFFIVEMDYTLIDSATGEAFAVRAMGAGDSAAVTKDGREIRDASGLKKAQTGAARYFFQKCFLIADGSDDEADHGKPAPESRRREAGDPVARTLTDLITPKQAVAVRAIATAGGIDAEKLSLEMFNARPEELSKKAAGELIDALKAGRKPEAALSRENDQLDAKRAKAEQMKNLAAAAYMPLKSKLVEAGHEKLSDLTVEQMNAWIAKLEPLARRLTDREAADLRSAFQERGTPPAEWLKDHHVGTGMCEDASLYVYNLAMRELFN